MLEKETKHRGTIALARLVVTAGEVDFVGFLKMSISPTDRYTLPTSAMITLFAYNKLFSLCIYIIIIKISVNIRRTASALVKINN